MTGTKTGRIVKVMHTALIFTFPDFTTKPYFYGRFCVCVCAVLNSL